ncbi:undecaprenyl/decaprenyl-phosphate alpha-N-acetylglucosaminyl 1-phosphate transferase [Planctomycetota bacterium]|nr:undecaprenyl/decaprenyl-phosphate alpha-N-acetylglucosaminyl 1-phosphate transferase [Planctomycetota bacterium]
MSLNLVLPVFAFVAALLMTPVTSLIARRYGWVDRPGLRKVHLEPVAYLGGAAVMGSLMLTLAVAPWLPIVDRLQVTVDRQLLAILVGGLLMFAVGLRDDIQRLGALTKLGAQLAAAGLVVLSGVSMDGIWLSRPEGIGILSFLGDYEVGGTRIDFGVFGVPLTIIWIVGATNALNIIDGLDSLASGLSVVACGAIAWIAFQGGQVAAGLMLIALMGSIGGFMPHNLHPARVFLGDAGSLSIGFILSASAALVASGASTLSGFSIPLVALGIPILDISFAMARRFIEGRSVMSADRSHIHHRLIKLGFGQRKAVAVLVGTSAAATSVVVLAAAMGDMLQWCALAVALFGLCLLFRSSGAIRIKESVEAFRQVASSARSVNDEKQALDELALAFKETKSLEEWWDVVAAAAKVLGFAELTMDGVRRDGSPFELVWEREVEDAEPVTQGFVTRIQIPVNDRREGSFLVLKAAVSHDSEAATLGRRLALFHPFLSLNGLERLPDADGKGKLTARAPVTASR